MNGHWVEWLNRFSSCKIAWQTIYFIQTATTYIVLTCFKLFSVFFVAFFVLMVSMLDLCTVPTPHQTHILLTFSFWHSSQNQPIKNVLNLYYLCDLIEFALRLITKWAIKQSELINRDKNKLEILQDKLTNFDAATLIFSTFDRKSINWPIKWSRVNYGDQICSNLFSEKNSCTNRFS